MEDNNLKIKEIEKSSIANRAYKSIKELILSKKIKGKINQEKIADLFGISRTPVVIALNQLTSESYLTQIPYKGFFVKKYSRKELEDLNEIRIIYEKLGVEKLINNITNEKVGVLKKFLIELKDYYEKEDIGNYRNLDISFHKYIIKQTDNNYIISQYLEGIIVPYLTSGIIPIEDSIKQHIKLVERIISKDLEESKKVIEQHIGSLLIE